MFYGCIDAISFFMVLVDLLMLSILHVFGRFWGAIDLLVLWMHRCYGFMDAFMHALRYGFMDAFMDALRYGFGPFLGAMMQL